MSALILFKSLISDGEKSSLLSYFAFRNKTLLCCGNAVSISVIRTPVDSSFSNKGLVAGSSDLYRVGILFMIASMAASLPGGSPSILESFPYKPCICFLLREPLCWYCLYRLIIKEERG